MDFSFLGKLTDLQEANANLILNECESYSLLPEQTAYVLATAWHESRFKPIEEIGKGKGKPYGSKMKYSGKPYYTPDKLYYGRGFVQLTWYELYEKFGKLLGLDLLNHPELALVPEHAIRILVYGMINGLFTGAKLSRFVNSKSVDFINARKVINGLDKAKLISGYADKILRELS